MVDEFEDFRHENRRVDAAVRSELGSGRKLSHWMWHVFPQRVELGSSHMAQMFGIRSLEQAQRYAADPELGKMLREHVEIATRHAGLGARQLMGYPDDMKLKSCLTLFALACPADAVFTVALGAFFAGALDEKTRELCDAEKKEAPKGAAGWLSWMKGSADR